MSAIETTPVIVISGVDEPPMAAVSIALQWDLPTAVAVRHEIDPDRERLIRTVSDSDGLIERIEIDVEHACISCAIREDVVPTLERLAASGRWQAIIAQLPLTADATQVCRVLGYQPAAAPHLRIAATVVALEGGSVHDDLLGDDLLTERELPVRDDDPRGVAETASAMVEYADVVVAYEADAAASDLIRAIARPDARLLSSVAELDAEQLLAGIHRHHHTEDWVQVVRREELPTPATAGPGCSTSARNGPSTPTGCSNASSCSVADDAGHAAASGCRAGPPRCANGTARAAWSASATRTTGTTAARSPGSWWLAWTTNATGSPRRSSRAW